MAPAPPSSQQHPLPNDMPFRVISKTIGTGAYAMIRRACPLNASKPVIAVKFISKEHALKVGRLTAKQINVEITLHKYLGKHQNIIHCLSNGENIDWTWIAMELAEGGDLFDKIEADDGVSEDVAHLYFTQLLSAVSFMHSKGVAHRDIKPENVLLSAEGDLKLADFGLAALFKRDGKIRLCNTVCGSPPYIAPEIVTGRKTRRTDMLDTGYQANVSDIWSCGVLLFVLLAGNTPWDQPTMDSDEFREYVETDGRPREDELWEKIPPTVVSLLRGMLKIDATTRFNLEEIRTHPWFTRPNRYLAANGRVANPVALATDMLERLRIDFNQNPSNLTATQQAYVQRAADPDAMDIDSEPHRSRANPLALISSTQPETPTGDVLFDWERPPRLGAYDGIPASQPVAKYQGPTYQPTQGGAAPFLSQLPSSTQGLLSQDPSLTQFSQTASIPMTLTQAARKFKDVLPNYSMARFMSPFSMTLLVPRVAEALHRLNIPVQTITDEQLSQWEREGEAWIRVKMVDGRRQGLNGHLVVERITYDGVRVTECRFLKASGDPVEWRRFFKRVVACVGDCVLRPD